MYPFKVKGEFETIRDLIAKKASISRFGDGEIKLCLGRRQISQEKSPKIKRRLIQVLKSDVKNLFIGIPRLGKANKLSDKKEKFWKKFRSRRNTQFYREDKQYHSAFISRADAALHIDCKEYWQLCKELWRDRNVVLVKGEERSFDKDNSDIFETANSVEYYIAPLTNAFQAYERILGDLTLLDCSTLFVLSLGPTATILAHDLCIKGYQALDLGHFGMMYSKTHHYYNKGENFFQDEAKTTDK